MTSTIRRFGPMFILLMIIWSFTVNFAFGLFTLTTVFAIGISVYHISVKKWDQASDEELGNFNLEDFSESVLSFDKK